MYEIETVSLPYEQAKEHTHYAHGQAQAVCSVHCHCKVRQQRNKLGTNSALGPVQGGVSEFHLLTWKIIEAVKDGVLILFNIFYL